MTRLTKKARRFAGLLVPATLLMAGCGGGANDSQEPTAAASAETSAPADAATQALPRTPAPEGARVFVVAPADGATVSAPFTVEFGAENVDVAPAGEDKPASGHHHLIVNAPLPEFGQPIPANDQYRHFGGGQTETTLELEPGEYTLQLLLGDHLHIPHEPPIYSETITISVE